MKWIDYREKLGICWNDKEKTVAFQQKISLYTQVICERLHGFSGNRYKWVFNDYFFTVGENPPYKTEREIIESITKRKSITDIISKYVAFVNSIAKQISKDYARETLEVLYSSLKSLNIAYYYTEDDDGIFIFPKGAPELDEALVSAPLEWLNDYPKSRTAWIKALKDYADQTDENASDIADKFRKALETFLQEFFAAEKNMNQLKSLYGNYLKSQGIPAEVQNGLDRILDCYDKFMNKYAKHYDRTSRKVLEYIMYETGNVMRLLITLKQEETSNAD